MTLDDHRKWARNPVGVPPWASADGMFAMSKAEPIREIEIGGRTYPVGEIAPEVHAAIRARAVRVAEMIEAATPSPGAPNPTLYLRHLLDAGSPCLDWTEIAWHVSRDHLAIAMFEFLRQCAVRAYSADATAGRA